MQFENGVPRAHLAMTKPFMHGFKSLRKSGLNKRQKRNLPQKRGAGVAVGGKKKSGEKVDVTKDRLSGFEQFSGKVGIMSLEAIEAAAEEAGNETSDEVDIDDLDENLFDDDDDLDDLDFDSSDVDDDDDDDDDVYDSDEPDI